MKIKVHATTLGLMLAMMLLAPTISAQDAERTFLSDYSGLKPAKDNPFDEFYIAPGALAGLAKYKSVMVDQPELFIHPESKYQGMKPDDMKFIADGLRAAITNELKDGYQIVDAPGANVLYIRVAVGDIWLQKKKRKLLAYTPAGALLKAGMDMTKEVSEKVDLKNMKVEGEILDSQSLEQLAAMTTSRGSLSGKPETEAASWNELTALFGVVGKRLRCRLDNSHKPESEWVKCGTIGLPSAEAK
jgi:hypothetical protein